MYILPRNSWGSSRILRSLLAGPKSADEVLISITLFFFRIFRNRLNVNTVKSVPLSTDQEVML
jgi:hypothetical protein